MLPLEVTEHNDFFGCREQQVPEWQFPYWFHGLQWCVDLYVGTSILAERTASNFIPFSELKMDAVFSSIMLVSAVHYLSAPIVHGVFYGGNQFPPLTTACIVVAEYTNCVLTLGCHHNPALGIELLWYIRTVPVAHGNRIGFMVHITWIDWAMFVTNL
jgi:hypothetical protein